MTMLYLLLFLIQLVILFLISRRLQQSLAQVLYRLTKNKNLTIYIMSALFLPGTFVHEMAHFLFALILFVPVGEMELIPKIEKDGVKLGSVAIAKTDFVRRFLIGAAPFILGTSLILLILYYVFDVLSVGWGWELAIAGYGLFTISNTMFSSKKDMEGMWGFFAFIIFILVTIWVLDINIRFGFLYSPAFKDFFRQAVYFLMVPVSLDVLAVAFLSRLKK